MVKLNPALVDDKTFFPLLTRLADCLADELDKAHGPGRCYTGLMLGTQAAPLGLMNCRDGKCGGVAWVRPMLANPVITFPLAAEPSAVTRQTRLAMQVEVGVARCLPRPEGRDMQPDPQDMFNAARLYMSDLQAARRAILCCLPDSYRGEPRDVEVGLGEWQPLEAGAGISGGFWTAWIA